MTRSISHPLLLKGHCEKQKKSQRLAAHLRASTAS